MNIPQVATRPDPYTGTERRPRIFRDDLLQGRIGLVTGGSSGIGLGIVRSFAELGATVVFIGRREDKLAEAREHLLRDLPSAELVTIAVDVRNHAAMREAVDGIVGRFGCLDILVNNAAGNFHCPTEQLSENGWRAVIDIDLNGTFNGCQAALAGLKASSHGGRIINITVPQALSGWPGSAHAASAKAGVLSLTRSLAVEWGGYGIRVNNVLPGPIAGTEGLKRLYEDRGIADHEYERMAMGTFGLVDDIANACAFLASPGGDFVTGCDFMVDGGRWLKRGWV
ncbi:SDR family oxidoreductase [Reyranella sp.]|uniref:SDR family oxidoreductase n=1 Tax=Reyranella sp. TaxID=1929291 RepID=UPI0025D890F3|nr:SDR family oxidoreductase [Reyranella sp.]